MKENQAGVGKGKEDVTIILVVEDIYIQLTWKENAECSSVEGRC